MKLTFVGGAGVRIPLFVEACIRRRARIGLDEICLMDTDERKLAVIGAICQLMVRNAGDPFMVTITADPKRALADASYVVTTIRAGLDECRISDERIALSHGVLGQETTGPAGFGMALRNVPAILAYAELLDAVNPGAWLFNFTNPAGLVVQALTDAGIKRAIGICDSANTVHRGVAAWLGVPVNAVAPEVFGLNHLSWTRCVRQDGADRLAGLLRNPAFLATTYLRMYEPELLAQVGMAPNEYLYYYYYAERALADIQGEERTRGEEVAAINRSMLAKLAAIDASTDPEGALRTWRLAMSRREATYMHYAFPDGGRGGGACGARAACATRARRGLRRRGARPDRGLRQRRADPYRRQRAQRLRDHRHGSRRRRGGELRRGRVGRDAARDRRDPRAAAPADEVRQAVRAADGGGHRPAIAEARDGGPHGAPPRAVLLARPGPGR